MLIYTSFAFAEIIHSYDNNDGAVDSNSHY